MSPLERYLSGLTVTQGRRADEPFAVLPWQRRFVRGAFAPEATTAALSVARGNGKTALLSAVACATLDGPLMVPRGETLIVASSFMQATIAFEHIVAFMGDKLKDRRRWVLWQSGQLAKIQCRATGASVRCLGSDPKRAHGLAPSLVLADEPAQWPTSTGDRMLAALRTAAGKQPDSRFVALGTRPAAHDHWFARLLNGGADYAQSHAADPDLPPFQRRTWAKANPSMSHMPDLERTIRKEAAEARSDGMAFPQFRSLRLNGGTSDSVEALLLEVNTWAGLEGDAERRGRCCWGFDLGTSAAMSAISAYWPDTGRLEVLAAFPHDPPLSERGLRDGVGRLYLDCHDRGELVLAGARAVDLGQLLRAALDRFTPPVALAADRWRESELRDALDRANVPHAKLVTRGQGFKDGAEDVRDFQRACLEGKVTPARSLLLRYAISEARVVMDPSANAKLAKSSAASTGRCNTSVESLCRCFKPQGFAWPFVELTRHFVQMSLRVYRHVGAFGEVLSEQTISVLIGTPLPWALRITEADIDVGRQAEPAMVREFLAPVPGQGLVELGRQLPRLPDERGYHCQGFLVGNPYQHHVTRLTFDQGRDVAVLRSRQQITFPVTRHRPIFDRGRALTDRHHVPDLTPANAFPARLFRASDRALRPKMLKQLLLKHTAGLNKQTAIDRLVRHLIRPSSWMRSLEPSGDLLR